MAKSTTLSLVSSKNPIVQEHAITFTATVSPVGNNASPTGNIIFRTRTAIFATVKVVNRVAKYVTQMLPVGTTTIIAQFVGSGGWSDSSTTIAQVVTETVVPPTDPYFFDDSALAPAGLESVCLLPRYTIYNVKNYGAIGSGSVDDTVAIRAAINAAIANGSGIIYFPTGTYAVAPQIGDPEWNVLFPVIFYLTNSNLIFIGDGVNNTILKGYMNGLANPVTTWNNTGDSYSKISRFGMFRIDSSAASSNINNVQWRSMTIDGQAGWTGDYTVGGNTSTGDGWDLSHKGIAMDGNKLIDNIFCFNCVMKNWRGEVVYGGGANPRKVYIVKSTIKSSNSSAISISANLLMSYTNIGGQNAADDVYNGVENFDINSSQKTFVDNCNIRCGSSTRHGNAIAYLGIDGASLTVQNSVISYSNAGILYSETAFDVVVNNNVFSNNANHNITSILGLYPSYPTGFSDFLISNNSFVDGGTGFLNQSYGTGYSNFINLNINSNLASGVSACLMQGSFNGSGWYNFTSSGNIIGLGAKDTNDWAGNIALWTNTTRVTGSVAGTKVDNFSPVDTLTVIPHSDYTLLNSNSYPSGNQNVKVDPTQLIYYPVGFETTFKYGGSTNWVLRADSSWNTFGANQVVGVNGVRVRFNGTKFDLVS